MKKRKIFFLSVIFFITFALQLIFFFFIVKINNLNKILNIKNILYNIILLSNNVENEIKGVQINNHSFRLSMPSIDINKTFILNNKDIVIITYDKPILKFTLQPSKFSARENKVVQFTNVKAMQIMDRGFLTFSCNINGEIIEADFYINKNVNLFPEDFKVF